MSVLDFPDVSPDVGSSLSLKTNSTTFTSELNNAVQTGKLVGDQWSANMPFTNRTEKEGRRIKAFLARLGGMTGRFRMTPPEKNQLGTMSFERKRDRTDQQGKVLGYKNGLAINHELATTDTWSVKKIDQRTQQMVNDIISLFDYDRHALES